MKNVTLYLIVLFIALLFHQNKLFAQKGIKERAKNHIIQLKESAIIVVLNTGNNQINAYIKANNTERADKIKKENRQKQLELIQVFNRNFTFCKVYFIFNSDLQKAKAGNLNDVLLNDSLEHDIKLQIQYSSFYFCRIGDIYFDTFSSTMDGLVLYDSSYSMLKKPFPYYLRRHYSLTFVHRDDDELVFDYNNQLIKFYNKSL